MHFTSKGATKLICLNLHVNILNGDYFCQLWLENNLSYNIKISFTQVLVHINIDIVHHYIIIFGQALMKRQVY